MRVPDGFGKSSTAITDVDSKTSPEAWEDSNSADKRAASNLKSDISSGRRHRPPNFKHRQKAAQDFYNLKMRNAQACRPRSAAPTAQPVANFGNRISTSKKYKRSTGTRSRPKQERSFGVDHGGGLL